MIPFLASCVAYLLLFVFTVVCWRRFPEEASLAVWWLVAPIAGYMVLFVVHMGF